MFGLEGVPLIVIGALMHPETLQELTPSFDDVASAMSSNESPRNFLAGPRCLSN